MALDGMMLSMLRAELWSELENARIDKIHQPSKDEIVMHMRRRDGNLKLLISARSGSARVCLTNESFESIEKRFEGKGYGEFKREVAEVVAGLLLDIQEKYF